MPRVTKTRSTNTPFLLLVFSAVLAIGGASVYLVVGKPPTSEEAARANGVPFLTAAQAAQRLPATIDPKTFQEGSIAAAYTAAKEIPEVLAQEPCYCHCDRMGHQSLLDCFGGDPASDCDICLKEALFVLLQHRLGQTPSQIRDGINHGAWEAIQL